MEYNLEKQHQKGKLHAIERINFLLDKDSFLEIYSGVKHNCTSFGLAGKEIPYDGVITGFGNIHGRKVAVFSQDFTVQGGTLGRLHGQKIAELYKKAIDIHCPVIGINDSGGARIQEGVNSLAAYGDVFMQNVRASGYIPQISIIAGPCAGGAVYSPGIADFIKT
jgi:acetyl-CoA carboxylase carboxyltransferase component